MIKVFVIDDSAVVRSAFKRIFEKVADIELIGSAPNPVDAFNIFKKVGLPDVFILDIEMPKMDGLEFLQLINQQKPVPVIICSTMVGTGSSAAVDALRMGAVDIVHKPNVNLGKFFDDATDDFLEKVRAASRARVHFNSHIATKKYTLADDEYGKNSALPASKKIVAIGSSTGGVQVIEEIVRYLKPNHPAIVITQHMPAGFTKSFAERLDFLAPYSDIREASEGDKLLPGRILIAPGDLHMEVKKSGFSYEVTLKDYPRVSSHKPSVNVLFASMAKEVGSQGVGIILTGMGEDGAAKLLSMREAGATTYAQEESSCTVYGMPKKAVEYGAVKISLSIFEIANMINNLR
ncbi:MAG: chemotaxis response regulator protein-glutamate methylesterase [Campylobacterales bacterium]|nr:chemotaxis response regulator protein-glutamate methylesterase [Campylobacterales bacterium]